MSQGPRVLRPERDQLRWDMVDLDSQLPPEHQARLVWSYVSGMELRAFYARIRARDDAAGRPASDPAVLLAVWLYATLEGIGVARAIARLCEYHSAYRWLCGGVPVNHDLLSSFRRESGAVLDGLLTQSLTGLIAEGLVTVEEVIIDGTKTQARAGRGSLAQDERLTRIEARVAEHVARLRRELAADPARREAGADNKLTLCRTSSCATKAAISGSSGGSICGAFSITVTSMPRWLIAWAISRPIKPALMIATLLGCLSHRNACTACVSSIERSKNTLVDFTCSMGGTIADAPTARISLSYGRNDVSPVARLITSTHLAARSIFVAS